MTQKRQFITDEAGKPVAVILPLEDYNRVRSILEAESSGEAKLKLMKEAAEDDAFLDDLEETSKAFKHVDAQWWEPS